MSKREVDTTVTVELEYAEEVIEFVDVHCIGVLEEIPAQMWCRNGDPGEPASFDTCTFVDFDLQAVIDTLELHFTEDGRPVPAWVHIEASQVLEELVEKVKEQVEAM